MTMAKTGTSDIVGELQCGVLVEYFDSRHVNRVCKRKSTDNASLSYKMIPNGKSFGYQIIVTDISNTRNRDIFISSKLKVVDRVAGNQMLVVKIPEFRCILHCLNIADIEKASKMINTLTTHSGFSKSNEVDLENSVQDNRKYGCTKGVNDEYFSQDIVNLPAKADRIFCIPSPVRSKQFTSTPVKSPREKMVVSPKPLGAYLAYLGGVKKSRTPVKTDSTPSDKKKRIGKTPTKNSTGLNILETSISLNCEQLKVLKACLSGANVFFTGGAGTGKSTLLHKIINDLNDKHGADSVYVTATTGLAACNIGGITIHQFAGIGLMDGSVEDIVKEVMKRLNTVRRWRQAKVLLIDEISMLGPKQFDAINAVAKAIRNNPGPMGGLQCIFTGDFLQLPPVSRTEILNSKGGSFEVQRTIFSQWTKEQEACQKKETFCFQTAAWKSVVQKNFLLRQVFRQKDQEFIELLDAVRFGHVTEDILKGFTSCVQRSLDSSDGILPTKIFTHRKDVDELNKTELDRLPGQTVNFEAIDSGEASYLAVLQSHCPAKKVLGLKIGAQVILLKTINSAEGLVNGSRGVVTRFTSETNRPVVKFSDGIERPLNKEVFQQSLGGRVVAQRQQYPLDLSWGISVHKSQGMTVDKAIVNLQKVFEYGQSYVALSRVRSKGGLSLSGPLQSAHIKAHPDVVSFYTALYGRRDVDSPSNKKE